MLSNLQNGKHRSACSRKPSFEPYEPRLLLATSHLPLDEGSGGTAASGQTVY